MPVNTSGKFLLIRLITLLLLIPFFARAQLHEIVYGDTTFMKLTLLIVGTNNPVEEWKLKNPVPDGKWQIWRDNSKKIMKAEGEVQNGKIDGTWIKYDKKGKKAVEINYNKGILNGEEVYFNVKNGSKLLLYTYKNGMKDGLYFICHASGLKWEEGYYREGLPTGQWRSWDKEGKLLKERTFAAGKLIHQKDY